MIDLNGQSRQVLENVLGALEPVELEGMQLLSQLRPPAGRHIPASYKIDRETLRRATVEIIAYTERCYHLRSRLAEANPVPLTDLVIAEFGL